MAGSHDIARGADADDDVTSRRHPPSGERRDLPLPGRIVVELPTASEACRLVAARSRPVKPRVPVRTLSWASGVWPGSSSGCDSVPGSPEKAATSPSATSSSVMWAATRGSACGVGAAGHERRRPAPIAIGRRRRRAGRATTARCGPDSTFRMVISTVELQPGDGHARVAGTRSSSSALICKARNFE